MEGRVDHTLLSKAGQQQQVLYPPSLRALRCLARSEFRADDARGRCWATTRRGKPAVRLHSVGNPRGIKSIKFTCESCVYDVCLYV